MSDLNNQIQNYSSNNFSNDNQNDNNPLIVRQGYREMQLNINPEVFRTTILTTLDNFIRNNINNINNQNQIQIWQSFGKEISNMSNHLKDAFQAVNNNIDDLRQKCAASFSNDQEYKEKNNNNINFLAQENSALKEKTNNKEDSNNNII